METNGCTRRQAKPDFSSATARAGAKRRRRSRDPSRPTSRPSRLERAGEDRAKHAAEAGPALENSLCEKFQSDTSVLAAGPRLVYAPPSGTRGLRARSRRQAPATGAKLRARDVWAPAPGTIPLPPRSLPEVRCGFRDPPVPRQPKAARRRARSPNALEREFRSQLALSGGLSTWRRRRPRETRKSIGRSSSHF